MIVIVFLQLLILGFGVVNKNKFIYLPLLDATIVVVVNFVLVFIVLVLVVNADVVALLVVADPTTFICGQKCLSEAPEGNHPVSVGGWMGCLTRSASVEGGY